MPFCHKWEDGTPQVREGFSQWEEHHQYNENISNDSIKRPLNDLACSFMASSRPTAHLCTIWPAVYTRLEMFPFRSDTWLQQLNIIWKCVTDVQYRIYMCNYWLAPTALKYLPIYLFDNREALNNHSLVVSCFHSSHGHTGMASVGTTINSVALKSNILFRKHPKITLVRVHNFQIS